MHFDFVEVFKHLNFLLIPVTPLVLQCFIFCSTGPFFAQYPLRESLVLLISVYGLVGAVIIPWIQGWTCDQAWPIIMLHFFSCNASFGGGHVNQIWLVILGKKHPLSLGVSKLMKGKPVPAADHFGCCSGRTCQRMKPTDIKAELRDRVRFQFKQMKSDIPKGILTLPIFSFMSQMIPFLPSADWVLNTSLLI